MEYGRHAVLSGQVVPLRVVFTDGAGKLVDTDAVPDVYIYDESVDDETIATELGALTFTSALAGPLTPTLINTGFYELDYTVPGGSTAGSWHDVWVAEVDTTPSNKIFDFNVVEGAVPANQTVGENTLIIIELDSTIQNLAMDKTLGEDVSLSFSSRYNPLYASPDLLRLEVGTFINYIPDDTLALLIHWSSKEADFITPPAKCTNRLAFARTKFVIYDAALRAITMPGGQFGFTASQGVSADGSKKSLGDLMIDRSSGGGSTVPSISSGVDVETLDYIRDQRNEWWRVVNAGACIVPGQGLGAHIAVRGINDPDRHLIGRLWENPENVAYARPTVNTKILRPGHRRARHGYSTRRRRNRRG